MDYYRILEIPIDADLECIRFACRCKAKEYSRSTHMQLKRILKETQFCEWDEAEQFGFTSLPSNIEECSLLLYTLETNFAKIQAKTYFNSVERKSKATEPNLILISSIEDCSLPSTMDIWKQARSNLFAVE